MSYSKIAKQSVPTVDGTVELSSPLQLPAFQRAFNAMKDVLVKNENKRHGPIQSQLKTFAWSGGMARRISFASGSNAW